MADGALPVQRMREYLRADAGAREASASRFMAGVGLAVMPMALALGPVIGWRLSGLLVVVIAPFTGYELVVLTLMRSGRYATWISWVNVLLEISMPCAVISVDLATRGPEYALTSPPLVIWAALIMFAVLRASRSLCIAAGALAAIEYLIFYFVFAMPRLSPPVMVSLSPAFICIRAFLLLCAGFGAAILTQHLLRKAEEALAAVRAQDLMSKYFLHEKLGAGGMAEVFRATYCPEGGFERVVAIKRVLPTFSSDPHFTQMFRSEAQLCARLNHPNIVQVTDVGRFDGRYILAMEFVDGLPLNTLLRALQKPLPPAAVAYLGAELAAALDYLHARTDESGRPLGLVHRDVNPPNVLVSRIGEVKLSDFGVAHAAGRGDSTSGEVVGKLNYLAPEQARAEPLDGRTDLFSLGLTLYEALTGARVIHGDTREQKLESVFKPPARPTSFLASVPADLERVVMGLLEQDAANRPSSGRVARSLFMNLEGAAAPLPNGRELLVRAVDQVMRSRSGQHALPELDADPGTMPTETPARLAGRG